MATIIIAHRRKGNDYWEGYTEKPAIYAKQWVDYYRKLNHVVKVFGNMVDYRVDCDKLLDKWEAKRAL